MVRAQTHILIAFLYFTETCLTETCPAHCHRFAQPAWNSGLLFCHTHPSHTPYCSATPASHTCPNALPPLPHAHALLFCHCRLTHTYTRARARTQPQSSCSDPEQSSKEPLAHASNCSQKAIALMVRTDRLVNGTYQGSPI